MDRDVSPEKIERGKDLIDRLQIELGSEALLLAYKTPKGCEVVCVGNAENLMTLSSTAFIQIGMQAVFSNSASFVEPQDERMAQ